MARECSLGKTVVSTMASTMKTKSMVKVSFSGQTAVSTKAPGSMAINTGLELIITKMEKRVRVNGTME